MNEIESDNTTLGLVSKKKVATHSHADRDIEIYLAALTNFVRRQSFWNNWPHDLPILLGSIRNTKLTSLIGWHALTLFWWAQSAVLIAIAIDPATARTAFLLSLCIASALIGLVALILSQGKHRSWIFFLPLAILTGSVVAGG